MATVWSSRLHHRGNPYNLYLCVCATSCQLCFSGESCFIFDSWGRILNIRVGASVCSQYDFSMTGLGKVHSKCLLRKVTRGFQFFSWTKINVSSNSSLFMNFLKSHRIHPRIILSVARVNEAVVLGRTGCVNHIVQALSGTLCITVFCDFSPGVFISLTTSSHFGPHLEMLMNINERSRHSVSFLTRVLSHE